MKNKGRLGFILLIAGLLSAFKAEMRSFGPEMPALEGYYTLLAILGPGLILAGLVVLFDSIRKQVPEETPKNRFLDIDGHGDIIENGVKTGDIRWGEILLSVPFFIISGAAFFLKTYIAFSLGLVGIIWVSTAHKHLSLKTWIVTCILFIGAFVPVINKMVIDT